MTQKIEMFSEVHKTLTITKPGECQTVEFMCNEAPTLQRFRYLWLPDFCHWEILSFEIDGVNALMNSTQAAPARMFSPHAFGLRHMPGNLVKITFRRTALPLPKPPFFQSLYDKIMGIQTVTSVIAMFGPHSVEESMVSQ